MIRTLLTLLLGLGTLSCTGEEATEVAPLEEITLEPSPTPAAPADKPSPSPAASNDDQSLEELADSYDDVFQELEAERDAEAAAREARRQERLEAEEAARQQEAAERQRQEEQARQRTVEAETRETERRREAAAELASREAALATNAGIQELQAEIERYQQEARGALEAVRRWAIKEAETLLSDGRERPGLGIAEAGLLLEGVADNLDPSGAHAAKRKYMWIAAHRTEWRRRWSRILSPREGFASLQRDIASTPLHPWAVLLDVKLPGSRVVDLDDRSAPSDESERFFPDRPTVIFETLGAAALWADLTIFLAECAAGGPCDPPNRTVRLLGPFFGRSDLEETVNEHYGGLDNLTDERVKAAQDVTAALDKLWESWEAADDSARELLERIAALEILNRR